MADKKQQRQAEPLRGAESFAAISGLVSGYAAAAKAEAAISAAAIPERAKASAIASELAGSWAKAAPKLAQEAGFPTLRMAFAALESQNEEMIAPLGMREGKAKEQALARAGEARGRFEKMWGERHWDASFKWEVESLASRLGFGAKERHAIAGEAGLFEQAAAALARVAAEGIGAGAEEALAGHLGTSYQRDGVEGFSVPLMAAGIRKARVKVQDKYVAGASAWSSLGGAAIELTRGAKARVAFRGNGTPLGSLNAPNMRRSAPAEGRLAEAAKAKARGNAVDGELDRDLEAFKRAEEDLEADAMAYTAADLMFGARKAKMPSGARLPSGMRALQALRSGANLAGKLEGSRAAEEPLPCVESAKAHAKLWGGFAWGLAAGAAMRACGDAAGFGSLARFGAVPLRVAMSGLAYSTEDYAQLRGAGKERQEAEASKAASEWAELAKQAASSPVSFAVGLALDLAVVGAGASEADKSLAIAAEAFLAKAAKAFEAVADAAAARAQAKQSAWLAKQGLLEAWSSAKQIDKGKPAPTSRSLAWAMANPGAAREAREGGEAGAFCISVARAMGMRAEPGASDSIRLRTLAAFAAKGLGEAELEWAVANGLSDLLKDASEKALVKRGKEQMEALDRMDFACLLLSAAAKSGADPRSARECFEVAVGCKAHWLAGNDQPGRSESFARPMVEADLDSAKKAAELRRQAAAKSEKLGWLVGKALEAYEAYRADAQGKPGHRIADAFGAIPPGSYKWRSRAAAAKDGDFASPKEAASQRLEGEIELFESSQMGPVDWAALDTASGSWLDVALRRPPGISAALREAEARSDPASKVAALCAPALGIEAAASGNELAGAVRDALCERWGMGPAAWKAFLKRLCPK